MDANRLDDIFQVKHGIPVIAGLFIGMDGYEAEKILEELKDYKIEHSYEYPADLIFQMKIDFDCEYFSYSETVRTINLTFSGRGSKRDINFITKYIKEKYYHERVDEYLQKDADGEILSYMIDVYNDLYHFTICSKDNGQMAIYLKASNSDYEVYQSVNTISEDEGLKEFIKQSVMLCDKNATSPERIEEVMPIRYGIPSFMGYFLSDVLSNGISQGRLSDIPDDNFAGNPMKEDFDITYEYDLDVENRILDISLILPTESEGLWPIIKYLKRNIIVNSSKIEIEEDDCGLISKVKGYIKNDYLSVVILDCSDECNGYTQISISIRNDYYTQQFMALRTIFYNEGLLYFINGLQKFYSDGEDTQDARFNAVRKRFNTFKEGLQEFINWHIDLAHDMGGYTEEEKETDKSRFEQLWNTPGSEMPRIW